MACDQCDAQEVILELLADRIANCKRTEAWIAEGYVPEFPFTPSNQLCILRHQLKQIMGWK